MPPRSPRVDGFYRIKIVNKDGTFEYSTVVVVKAQKPVTKLTVTPNPTTGIFKIRIPSDNTGAMNLQLFGATGKLLMVNRLELLPGAKEVPVDISMFANGSYQLTLEGYKARWTTRIIKKIITLFKPGILCENFSHY